MNSFYIFSFTFKQVSDALTATIIFCSCPEIDESDLRLEIKQYFQSHSQPDKIFIIGSNKIAELLQQVFITNQNITFKGIPKRQETFLSEGLYLLSFDKDGTISCNNEKTVPEGFLKNYQNEGLQQIFKSRGGLIVSESKSHHYVFPSGKHCDRFLRTGNVLLYSPEIYFIAFCLLQHFNEGKYKRIYCDTSSINSIAFALFELKNNFLEDQLKTSIESFSSYDGLYKRKESYRKDSLLLISASTSSNILKYILENHKILERENIVVLYFLGEDRDFANVKDQVLCNLTKSADNPDGIEFYKTYLASDCKFCKMGSYAVPVVGDIFLLEKPHVNKMVLSVDDREANLSTFAQQFISVEKKECFLKSHFKEHSERKYETYIDFSAILKSMDGNVRMEKFKEKIEDYISQYIPADSKYLLHLTDGGSKEFAELILSRIASRYKTEMLPKILSQDSLTSILPDSTGTVVVVGSCISNGKNLLYISRALRKHSNLKIVYFIGITRTANREYQKRLVGSLTRGKYRANTNSFHTIETIFCSSQSRETPWIVEIDFLKDILQFIDNRAGQFQLSRGFFEKRKQLLEVGSGETTRGITEDLFYDRVTTATDEKLYLRKNFAFFDFEDYDGNVTQADVYFTISNIINSLRYTDKADRQLKQTVYVRNLLDPHNFSRFNDGVIQASLLRAASVEELAFHVDTDASTEMFNTLDTIIEYYEQEQGEALLEFLYAIATRKLSLTMPHLVDTLAKVKDRCAKEIFQCFREFIQEKLIDEPERVRKAPLSSARSTELISR